MSDNVEINITENIEEVTLNVQQNVEQVTVEVSASGQPGLSAYQIWLTEGNLGTEQDYLDSLIGPQGAQGAQGEPGEHFVTTALETEVLFKGAEDAEGDSSFVWDNTEKELNVIGTVSASSAPAPSLSIGDFFEGGVVFWINPLDNTKGLACQIADVSASAPFSLSNTVTGATGLAIGTGLANTNLIVADQGAGIYSAKLCKDVTDGGHNDWYLPSIDELNEVYLNKAAINATAIANGGSALSTNYYWSSTENNINDSWLQGLGSGYQYYNSKSLVTGMRAIRNVVSISKNILEAKDINDTPVFTVKSDGVITSGSGNQYPTLDDQLATKKYVDDNSIPHTGAEGEIVFMENNLPVGDTAFIWDNTNKRLGVGTTSPSQKLHVAGNLRVTGAYYDSNNLSGSAGQVLTSTGVGVDWIDPTLLPAESAEKVIQTVRLGEAVSKGDPLVITGYHGSGGPAIVERADATDATKMPAYGVALEDYANNATGLMIAVGDFNDFDTSSYSVGDTLYVAVGGGMTNVKPTGTALIQNMGIVSRSNANNGYVEIIAIGRTNDVPNLPTGRLFVGTATNTSLISDVVYVDDGNDRVGIGTTLPTAKLDIKGEGTTSGTKSLQIENSDASKVLTFSDDGLLRIDEGDLVLATTTHSNGTVAKIRFIGGNGGDGTMYYQQNRLYVSGTLVASAISVPRLISTAGNGGTVSDPIIGMTNGVKAGLYLLRGPEDGEGFGGVALSYNLASNSAAIEGFRLNPAGTVVIGGGSALASSSKMTINSTEKGFLPPRMTTAQKDAIASPATGLVVYDTDLDSLCSFNGVTWDSLTPRVKHIAITAATQTLELIHANTTLKLNDVTGVTLTVPLEATVAFKEGDVITLKQSGAGQITVDDSVVGVTVTTFKGLLSPGQYSVMQLVYEGSDVWNLIGGVS